MFGLDQQASVDKALRFFCYLVRVYSDAVRLAGNPIGLSRELIRRLGILTCALRDLVAAATRNRAEAAGDAAEDTDSAAGEGDPIDNGDTAEKGQETSPSVVSPAVARDCSCGDSNPTEGEHPSDSRKARSV